MKVEPCVVAMIMTVQEGQLAPSASAALPQLAQTWLPQSSHWYAPKIGMLHLIALSPFYQSTAAISPGGLQNHSTRIENANCLRSRHFGVTRERQARLNVPVLIRNGGFRHAA